MKMILFVVAAAALLFGYAGATQTPAAAGPKHHVAFQLSESEGAAWDALPVHVNNTMKALADDGGAQVEVVFWGPGIEMLRKTNSAYAERLKQLSDHGVKLLACRNAMKNRSLVTEDLFPFAGQVDSGIAEIVRKQESGWAYIH